MFETDHKLVLSDSASARAGELFEEQRQEAFRNTDRLFGRLMFFQWIAAILFALTPRRPSSFAPVLLVTTSQS